MNFFTMRSSTAALSAGILIAGLILIQAAGAAPVKTAALGDMVTLSGMAPGSDFVYLFLTGPNLPAEGVSLTNVNRPASAGGLTRVDVDETGRWTYKWYTGQLGGKLDAGAYTVWVTNTETDRLHISGSEYRTITVQLTPIGLSAETSTEPAAIQVNALPGGSLVYMDGNYIGTSPVLIPGPGTGAHVLLISHPGYSNLTTQVIAEPGTIQVANLSLSSVNGSLYINTTPTGADIFVDGMAAGMSPLRLYDLKPGTYTITAEKAGFLRNVSRQEVRVIGGHMSMADLAMVPETSPPGVTPTKAAMWDPIPLLLCLAAGISAVIVAKK